MREPVVSVVAPTTPPAPPPPVVARTVFPSVPQLRPPNASRDLDESPPPGESRPARDPEAYRQMRQTEHEVAIATVASQSRDPRWSRQAEASLTETMKRLKAATPALSDATVDCRSTSCTIATTWTSHSDAREHFGALLQERWDVNCAREIYLNPPEKDGPYSATLVLSECQRQN